MISSKKTLACVETLVKFHKEQSGCQNCIFRRFGSEHWHCQIEAYGLQEVLENIKAKKKNQGYL